MSVVRYLYKFMLFLGICVVVFLCGVYAYAYFTPKIDLNTANAVTIYDNENNLIFQTSGNKDWIDIKDMSVYIKDATVSVEDKNFYFHQGFDYLRIVKAMYLNITKRTIIQGASTISQQYVKNLFLDFDQKWERKIEEAFLTIKLEVRYSKEEILEGYLNTIDYGQGNYGIESASKYYFNKSAKDLTLEEAIMLAGIPKNPGNFNPVSNYDNAVSRAKVVAKTMVTNKYITENDCNSLYQNQLEIYGKKDSNNMQTLLYFRDAIIQELNGLDNIPKSLINSGGLKIYTTLNTNVQKKLDESIINYMEDDDIQVSSIVVEPTTGGVLALAGGKNYSKSQFNRATQAKRQVGSTIKPFLYYTALVNNMTEASTFKSEKTSFVFSDNQKYSPKNYSNAYANKDITMAAAIAYSDNVFAVKTHLFLGEEKLVDTLKMVGLKQSLKAVPSLALGAQDINMLDYAQAYNVLANYGIYTDVHFINKIENMNGDILYIHKSLYDNEQVLDQDYTYIINEMLTNTYNSQFVDYLSPTVMYLENKITHKYALKSGTTENDYWIVGYNPNVLMLVWAGNDQNNSVPSTYSKKIKDIWCDTVEDYLKEKEETWYQMSENIVGIPLNAISGKSDLSSKNSTLFYFKKGSEPISSD